MTEELLAQLVEEVSVLTSDRRRKEPIEVPRPGDDRRARVEQTPIVGNAQVGMKAHGMAGMLAAAQVYGVVQR